MKKFLLITTIAFATIAAAPAGSKGTAMASAQTDASAQQASDVGPAANTAATGEKKICKQLPSSYSRMTKRACLTDKEWKQVEADVENDNGF
jgi:hypothetical protein